MRTIEKALIKEGYEVLNIDYPSRKMPINDIASLIFNQIKKLPQTNKSIHFVAHSMGCLIVRALLAKNLISNVGNIVFITPPNQGSEVADFLKNNFLYQHFYGPAGSELTTEVARHNPFPKIGYHFGVIAGSVCLDPISYFILPKGNDGKVSIESTKLEGMCDHIVLPCSHSFAIQNNEVIKQIKFFLKKGKFDREIESD